MLNAHVIAIDGKIPTLPSAIKLSKNKIGVKIIELPTDSAKVRSDAEYGITKPSNLLKDKKPKNKNPYIINAVKLKFFLMVFTLILR
jgi:hypothetical protein